MMDPMWLAYPRGRRRGAMQSGMPAPGLLRVVGRAHGWLRGRPALVVVELTGDVFEPLAQGADRLLPRLRCSAAAFTSAA